jgi:hypothetical protein
MPSDPMQPDAAMKRQCSYNRYAGLAVARLPALLWRKLLDPIAAPSRQVAIGAVFVGATFERVMRVLNEEVVST